MIEPNKKMQKCEWDYSYAGNTQICGSTWRNDMWKPFWKTKKLNKPVKSCRVVVLLFWGVTLDLALAQKPPYPHSSARFKVLSNSVCYFFISKDMHPY